MTTTIKFIPGHTIVAEGGPIRDMGNLLQYQVPQVREMPGEQLVIGQVYMIAGALHEPHSHGLFVTLARLPEGADNSATFNVDDGAQ